MIMVVLENGQEDLIYLKKKKFVFCFEKRSCKKNFSFSSSPKLSNLINFLFYSMLVS